MGDFKLDSWLEELAEATVLADASDERSIQKLLSRLAIPAQANVSAELEQLSVSTSGSLLSLLSGEAEDPDALLSEVSLLVDELQESIRKGRPLPIPVRNDSASQTSGPRDEEGTDRLLPLEDHPLSPVEARGRLVGDVDAAGDGLLATDLTGEGPGAADDTQGPCATDPIAPLAPVPVERDQETVELFGDFLQEGEEGLALVDEILVAAERSPPDAEGINALFRVFHTIKGVAGFLELTSVASLAHITETLLNQAREGQRSLQGVTLDLVFDGSSGMRKLLEGVRHGIETGTAFPTFPEIQTITSRIEAEIERPSTAGAGAGDESASATAAEGKAAAPAVGDTIPTPGPGAVQSPLPGSDDGPTAVPVVQSPGPSDPAPAGPLVQRPIPAPGDAAPAPVVQGPSHAAPGTPIPLPSPGQPNEAAPAQTSQNVRPGGTRIRETLKVDVERVDSMVEMIGELIIVESMVVHAPEIAAVDSLAVRNYLGQLTKISRDLQDVAMRMRMVPVQGVFLKMQRMVRELSRKTGKKVELLVSGEGTEMDRSMVERIEDPLVHMIRNAMDHGLEAAAERRATGKSETGAIRLSAFHEGGSVVVEIADDGRGLDREKILDKAIRQGIVREGEHLPDSEIYMLIFAPGFSTAAQVTEISGRGVGMDVVKRNIEAMRGRVMVSSTPGQGSVFKLILPLTLAIIDGMIVSCGSERYIIPSLSIVESLQPRRDMISTLAGHQELLNVRGEMLPLFRLSSLFGIEGAQEDATQALAVVVESMGRKVGLLVDDVVTQQQVVIKPLGSGIGDTETFSGGAILSDGKVGLILNIDRVCTNVGRVPHHKL